MHNQQGNSLSVYRTVNFDEHSKYVGLEEETLVRRSYRRATPKSVTIISIKSTHAQHNNKEQKFENPQRRLRLRISTRRTNRWRKSTQGKGKDTQNAKLIESA